MLTDQEKRQIAYTVKTSTPEQVRRFLETQAKQGSPRAKSLLEKIFGQEKKANSPTEDRPDMSDR